MEDVLSSLQQLVAAFGVLSALICALELWLYVQFYKFDRIFIWLLNVALASTVAVWSLGWGAGIGVGSLAGLLLSYLFSKVVRGRGGVPVMMLAPALIAVTLLIIFPFFFEVRLAFSKLNMYTIASWVQTGELKWAGWQNFINVFTSSPLQTVTFWELFLRTILWTFINIIFHVFFGLLLALLLNRPMKGKGWYRMLLIVPWAMPQVVAILAWRGEFHPQFGMINHLLESIGITGVSWWSDPIPVFVSCCIVNIWLGIPFMMIVILGGLQSIPPSLYEAAQVDGASRWRQFWHITVPMLKPVVVPSITLGTIWTFNNINVIYLMTGQSGGNEYADILVSALYKSAFTYSRYSFSAAFALVIFAILFLMTLFWMKVSRGTEALNA